MHIRTSTLLGRDAPQKYPDQDAFGLGEMAAAVADALTHRVTADGHVVGIEGRWGSGKTSFINFVHHEISQNSSEHRVIRFEPWLFNRREGLMAHLLSHIAAEIEGVRIPNSRWWHTTKWWRRRAIDEAARKIRKYGTYAELFSIPAAFIGSADPTGSALVVAGGLKAFGKIAAQLKARPTSLEHLKSEASADLRAVRAQLPNFRITVFIDDLDRLEPDEALEVLRLVRKAANFPAVTYVLCFDRKILVDHVERSLNVTNGNKYIEKIFQNIISIPPQEPFALRRFFRKLLLQSFPDEMNRVELANMETTERAQTLFDVWAGKFLKTPRDAVRLHEAIKFGWPHISTQADFYDFVWLQLIKLKAPKLYRWTQRYLTELAAYRDGGRPSDAAPALEAKRLKLIMDRLRWSKSHQISEIGYFLPGVSSFALDDNKGRVFHFKDEELESFERYRRLGSPSHWKQYFSFDTPSYAIADDDIISLRKTATHSPMLVVAKLRELLIRPHEQTGHFVDVLLDRLTDEPRESFSATEVQGFATAFADVMDEIAGTIEQGDFGQWSAWENAKQLLSSDVSPIFQKIVVSGESVNWLAFVIRQQAFAHGRPSDNIAHPEEQWLTEAELDVAIATITQRFEELGPKAFFCKPAPLQMLYCWLQLGDVERLKAFMNEATSSDEAFIRTLNGMRNWVSSSSKGVYFPVSVHNIRPFLDADAAKARLEQLASSTTADDQDIGRAAEALLCEWEER